MHLSKHRLIYFLCIAFIVAGSNFTAESSVSVIEKNQKHFDVANRFALYSLSLRQLKNTSCANKVNIVDHTEEDLTLIRSTFSEKENIYFSENIIAIKQLEHEEIEHYIVWSRKITGNLDSACQKLENLYKTNYKTAKEDFLRFIKAKTSQ
ncbi:MAG: hypothetical protein KAT06_01790 [Gammaproteobacteria bacterium]|nr:hypothetical protein [Gammaproteobacteria bacterium]